VAALSDPVAGVSQNVTLTRSQSAVANLIPKSELLF